MELIKLNIMEGTELRRDSAKFVPYPIHNGRLYLSLETGSERLVVRQRIIIHYIFRNYVMHVVIFMTIRHMHEKNSLGYKKNAVASDFMRFRKCKLKNS